MFWVVQENIREEVGYNAFVDVLCKHEIPHAIVKVIPFAYETVPDLELTGKVTVWGSVSLDAVAKKKKWTPGTFLNENHDQRVWTEAYGRTNMLNGDVEFFEFCKIPRFEGTKFIRPVDDKKRFDGTVVHIEELENWQEAAQRMADGYSRLRPTTMVGVSSVREIELEWRFFIVNGKVLTGSRYRQWGMTDQRRIDETSEAWKFAQTMVDKWQPGPAFVLDVAKVTTGELQVIEVNCINSAGFYACDMEQVVLGIDGL